MQEQEFIAKIRQLSGAATPEETERIASATIETLHEMLSSEMAEELAGFLPAILGDTVTSTGTARQSFSLDEFFERIAEVVGASLPEVVKPVNATLELIRESISPPFEEKLVNDLPESFADLFIAGPGSPADRSASSRTPAG